ncbi:PREDICTED: peptide transporter family 1-like [Diuraphis noxia]|uniref:peptide transporter family 1-like n=1 Tax=Diuraphis noxia TaxID=143948 RepID=UPI00076395E9|nr:PREDICTED: peptide transporter family 1-like [Diuraphis noxia]
MTSEKNHSYITHIIVPLNEDYRIWLHIKNLTLQSMSNNKITIFEEAHSVTQFQNNTVLKIPPGLYTLTIHYTDKKQQPISRRVLNLETNHIYTYRNEYDSKINSKLQSNTVEKTYVLSKEWLLPQFICMTFGETLFTMTGLSFSFSETPESMKTVSISMWYFCVALGNLIVIFINKFVAFEKKSNMFFMFASIALLTIFGTCKWSNTYEKLYYKNKADTGNENDRDNVNLVMLLKKESYQLSF